MWRSHKAELKEKYYMGGVSKEELLHLKPPEVDADLFCILVEYWFSKPGMVLIFSVLYVFFFYMINV